MKKLAVFSLRAVVRYDEQLLRSYLLEAINQVEGTEWKMDALGASENASQVVMDLYLAKLDHMPNLKKIEKISKNFTKRVRKYFIEEDDTFEIRPGVQSIFDKMEKQKKWKYCIVSNYWAEATNLMLQTCGVYSKTKFTITADEALTLEDQVQIARQRGKKKNKELKLFFIGLEEEALADIPAKRVTPRFSKSATNYYDYPKFSELFKKKK